MEPPRKSSSFGPAVNIDKSVAPAVASSSGLASTTVPATEEQKKVKRTIETLDKDQVSAASAWVCGCMRKCVYMSEKGGGFKPGAVEVKAWKREREEESEVKCELGWLESEKPSQF